MRLRCVFHNISIWSDLIGLDLVESFLITQIEGALKLKEIAEGGTNTSSLCLDVKTLWNKDINGGECPTVLPFSLTLPGTFWDGKASYPLPPSFEAHLSGLPGFRANIEYSVSAVVTRSKLSLFGLTNMYVYYHHLVCELLLTAMD